jgi:hypothetical protein
MEYKIIWNEDFDAFEDEVNQLIKEGWKPQGGVAIDADFWYQAMVREKPALNSGEYSIPAKMPEGE